MSQIIGQKLLFVFCGKPLLQLLDYFVINVALAKVPEGLNDQAARFPGGGHVAGRCSLENNL